MTRKAHGTWGRKSREQCNISINKISKSKISRSQSLLPITAVKAMMARSPTTGDGEVKAVPFNFGGGGASMGAIPGDMWWSWPSWPATTETKTTNTAKHAMNRIAMETGYTKLQLSLVEFFLPWTKLLLLNLFICEFCYCCIYICTIQISSCTIILVPFTSDFKLKLYYVKGGSCLGVENCVFNWYGIGLSLFLFLGDRRPFF